MQTQNNNGKCTYGIEKFEGTFDKEEIGVAIIPCKTINDIRDMDALGLYIYLLARPAGWKLNVWQLKEHFQCNKDKIYKLLNWLIKETFITCTMSRKKGQFTKPHYRVLLHRQSSRVSGVEITSPSLETQAGIDDSPRLEKPDTVAADTVNPDTYITENVVNIESKKPTPNPQAGEGKSLSPRQKGTNTRSTGTNPRAVGTNPRALQNAILGASERFIDFWSIYPVKKSRKNCEIKWKKMNLDEKAPQILLALKNQIANDDQWKRGYIPNPLTYINGELWNDDIVLPKSNGTKEKEVVYF